MTQSLKQEFHELGVASLSHVQFVVEPHKSEPSHMSGSSHLFRGSHTPELSHMFEPSHIMSGQEFTTLQIVTSNPETGVSTTTMYVAHSLYYTLQTLG